MKSILLSLFAMLLIQTQFAQTDSTTIATQVKSVTIYPKGAQINREISLNHKIGKSILIFEDLPFDINKENLQLGCNKLSHILALKLVKVYGSSQNKTQETLDLEAEIKTIKLKSRFLNNKLELLVLEKDLLLKNSNLNSTSTTIPLTELQRTVEYFNTKMKNIETDKLNIILEKEDYNLQLKNINKQLQELQNKHVKNTSKLIVTIDNKDLKNAIYTLTYFLEKAGWVPDYNLRVEDIDKPLIADYNATIFQSTGENWKNIDLTLSTVTPTKNEKNIELKTWVLEQKHAQNIKNNSFDENLYTDGTTGSIRGTITDAGSNETLPMANVVIKKGHRIIQGNVTDFDGRYIINPLNPGTYNAEISYIGYATKNINTITISPSKSTELNVQLNEDNGLLEEVALEYNPALIDADRKGTTVYSDNYSSFVNINASQKVSIQSIFDNIKQEITFPEFKIDAPFTILADSKETNVRIKSLEISTNYQYHIIPKVQQYAFLQAQIPNWTAYQFLPGQAKIYLRGKYIGQTYLDTDNFSDTLDLQLGKETDIQVQRTFEQKQGSKIMNGNKVKETIAYSILVKNNKPYPLNITVVDQIPITYRKDITIELLESDQAKVNPNIGQLEWDITLKPGEKKDINFSYFAKYPN